MKDMDRESYWTNKLVAYFHDPIHKVFDIQGHEDKAHDILKTFGLQLPGEKEKSLTIADSVAASAERGQVPGYSRNKNMNGAINFSETPVLTHPIGEKNHLHIKLPQRYDGLSGKEIGNEIHTMLIDYLEDFIGMEHGKGGYSDSFSNQPERFAKARFIMTHLALRFKLAEDNVGELGGLWHRIPADSRIPDHSLWQHNALVSSIYSCLELGGGLQNLGMMVFSITPVQSFISKARKLRDYWTSSMILSWLAFEGLKWVSENLGPDHVLYPSLIDQPLVNEYLKSEYELNSPNKDKKLHINSLATNQKIASFPNKFMVLVPLNALTEIQEGIENAIRKAWKACYSAVHRNISTWAKLDESGKEWLESLFNRQADDYWNLQWAAVKLTEKSDMGELKELLINIPFEKEPSLLNKYMEVQEKFYKNNPTYTQGLFYSVSHSLSQAALAAAKGHKIANHSPENGEKCHLCGEFEALHDQPFQDSSASEYKSGMKNFWMKLYEARENRQDLNEHERLCSICATKRFAPAIFGAWKNHILHASFNNTSSFPSTTELALYSWFIREKIDQADRKSKAQNLHERDEDSGLRHLRPGDPYYAILIMDGDHMGKLVNGETLASTWESVLHPDLVKRLKMDSFDSFYGKLWREIFKHETMKKRIITPACHLAISESLGDFSLYGVAPSIQKTDYPGAGRLIYAGGDDVCAVLPVSRALDVATEINRYYGQSFQWIPPSSDHMKMGVPLEGPWLPQPGKLSVNLGKGEQISISAAILICHHKESLSEMIARAHSLLDERAKRQMGRNACAIELRKRSGGSRYFARKWNDPAWKDFTNLGEYLANPSAIVGVSTSLAYRLEMFRPGIEAILEHKDWEFLLEKFLAKQLERSGVRKPVDAAGSMLHVVTRMEDEKLVFSPESLIVAAFMAKANNYKEN
jgi:CRISPR-associated protein Cmr2